MKIKKLRGDYCLIRPINEETTASGIKLAKILDQGDFMSGVVVLVGDWRVENQNGHTFYDIEAGNKVTFQYGVPIKVEDEMLMLVNESDIKLILE